MGFHDLQDEFDCDDDENGDEEDMSDAAKERRLAAACGDPSDEAEDDDRPKVDLLDHDGNAFVIIGACVGAARRAGWPKKKIDEVMKEMRSGDYDHLLQTAMKHFRVT